MTHHPVPPGRLLPIVAALCATVAALALLAALLAFGFKRGLVELVLVMAALGVALRLFF